MKICCTFWQDFDDAMAAENNLPANETPNLSESGSTVPDWLRRVNMGLAKAWPLFSIKEVQF